MLQSLKICAWGASRKEHTEKFLYSASSWLSSRQKEAMWKKVQANPPYEDYDLYLQGKKVSSKFSGVKFLDECFKQNL